MYNPIQKEEYMKTLNDTEKVLFLSTFNKIEQKEEEYNTDFCLMKRGQIVECLKLFGRESNIRPAFSRLRRYSVWAKENGYNKGINYSDSKVITVNELIDYIGQCEKRYYLPVERYNEYKNILNSSPNRVYLTSLFMSCYEGIFGSNAENLVHLRLKDVIHGNPIVLHDGTKRNISEELRKLLIECSTITQLEGRTIKYLRYSLYPDSIWRSVRDSKNQRRKFISMFDSSGRIKDLINDDNVTAEVLVRSGFFNFVVSKAKDYGYNIKEDMSNDIIQVREKTGELALSETTEKYDKIFKEYGSDMRFYSFKRLYKDWICYI